MGLGRLAICAVVFAVLSLSFLVVQSWSLDVETSRRHLPGRGAVTGPFANANPQWANLTGKIPTHPPASAAGVMAFDPKDNYTLFFGGGFGGNETWKYSRGTWTQLKPAVSPPGRTFAGMTYDAKDGYVVLWGGQGLNDTWKFAHGSWTLLHPSVSPPAFNPYNSTRETSISGMTYDAKDGYVVLVLQYSPGLGTNTTWTYSGGQWTQLHVKGPHRAGACMTYDSLDGYVLLFGGAGSSFSNPYPNNTWRFSGGTWTVVRMTGPSPVGRAYCGLDFDRALNAVVMFGGYQGGWVMNDTWEFAAGTWVNLHLSRSPPAVYWFLMTYDRADRYVVVFGGGTGNLSYTSFATWMLA